MGLIFNITHQHQYFLRDVSDLQQVPNNDFNVLYYNHSDLMQRTTRTKQAAMWDSTTAHWTIFQLAWRLDTIQTYLAITKNLVTKETRPVLSSHTSTYWIRGESWRYRWCYKWRHRLLGTYIPWQWNVLQSFKDVDNVWPFQWMYF